jgi:transposase-like protein
MGCLLFGISLKLGVSHIQGGTQAEDFENRVLRKIRGLKRDKQSSGKNYITNSSATCIPHQICIIRVAKSRRMMGGRIARMGRRKAAYRVFVGESEGKRPLGRLRRRWENHIKMDLQDVRYGAWTGRV